MRASAQRGPGSEASRLRVVDQKRAEAVAAARVVPPAAPGEEGTVIWGENDGGSDAGDVGDDFYFVQDPDCRLVGGDHAAAADLEAEFEAMANAMTIGAKKDE